MSKRRSAPRHKKIPLKKILIANRGEIACRIIRTAKRLGIETVALYTEPDDSALHRSEADSAQPVRSYLDGKQIIEIARRVKAAAIHPGYGFLAENAEFAEAVARARLTFIGPSAQAMRLLGNKVSARHEALRCKLPIVPGVTAGESSDLKNFVKKNGFPLMIKAAAGGGGRGMRRVFRAQDLTEMLNAAAQEARTSFGDDTLFVEKLIEGGRHIEVQIFGDRHGTIIAIADRDCSLQRKHQKVIEEAPAPGLSIGLRKRIAAAAIKLCTAARYTNAGTVEFLVAPDESFYFLEVNTRLQVEHPVTEMISGLDLVELQLRIAAGERLDRLGAKIRPQGHAIECRLCAENPDQDFTPATGRLLRFELPVGADAGSARVDTGFRAGDQVSHHYDSLLAKVVVHGRNREAARMEMEHMLSRAVVTGVQTNLSLLSAAIQNPIFRAGEQHLGTLGAISAESARRRAVAAALALIHAGKASTGDPAGSNCMAPAPLPWQTLDSWHAGGWRGAPRDGKSTQPAQGAAPRTAHILTVNGVAVEASLVLVATRPKTTDARRRKARTEITGIEITLEARESGTTVCRETLVFDNTTSFTWDGQRHSVIALPDGDRLWLCGSLGQYLVTSPPTRAATQSSAGPLSGEIRSPLPGTVVRALVATGDRVEAGQILVTIESMKMEHALRAPFSGRVRALNAKAGMVISKDHLLIVLDP